MRRALAVAIGMALAVFGSVLGQTAQASAPLAVHVLGNRLVNQAGATLQLRGVDLSGTEYACSEGWGIFADGAAPPPIVPLLTWGVNAVRLPLNEDCWLGINGVKPQWSGLTYRRAVVSFVRALNAAGLYVILDLHWSAPGTILASGQQVMADRDHSGVFWASMARTFRAFPATIFDLYNEPHISTSDAQTTDPWACWLDGCTIDAGGSVPTAWQSIGMQRLVAIVRGEGARNVIMAGGLAWSNDASQWLAYEPVDPLHQLALSVHVYNFNQCDNFACWDRTILPVAAQVPVITGEVGENDNGTSASFLTSYVQFANPAGVSYLVWTWDAWGCGRDGGVLIANWGGTPCAPYGTTYQALLAGAGGRP